MYARRALVAAATAALLGIACSGTAPKRAQTLSLTQIADRYVAGVLAFDPSASDFSGLPLAAHDTLPRNSAQAIAAWAADMDALYAQLTRIDPATLAGTPDANVYAVLKENLESDRGLRICHAERWNVSHMGGWQVALPQMAAAQPVATDKERAEALTRWAQLPDYVANEIANLDAGLAGGYAAPKSVVRRVLQQLDAMLAAKTTESPFYAPAANAKDADFAAKFTQLIEEKVTPAIRRYRDYLNDTYLPRARDSVALSALPDGLACYAAMLRAQTTLARSPQEVYDLGRRTVAANETRVADIGERRFGTRDIATIIAKVNDAPDNHFPSEQALVDFSRDMVADAQRKSAGLFAKVPAQPAIVEPEADWQRGSGVSSHYDPSPDPTKPGKFVIALDEWQKETRGSAEITAVHETWPGHHLQLALANEQQVAHPVLKLSFNGAYIEGWARYAERLAEEAGIYRSDYALISRRIWPARGMVVDPGIHAFGWTREQARDYLVATGRFTPVTAENTVDRIAVMPGQLTSYDSGGLEIFALREQAEKALGARFDLKQFHQRVLENGALPLAALRRNVETWIDQQRKQ